MTETTWQLTRDVHSVARKGAKAIAQHQRTRLDELVACARTNSPYYRELYQDLPDDPALFPVTSKQKLMARFDDWATDRAVTKQRVEEFIADPARVGQRFQGKYLVATTSGTSGLRGLFVLDERNLAVGNAVGSRARSGMGARDTIHMFANAGRTAVISEPGGHFFTSASAVRFRLDHPRLGRIMRVFSIRQPLPELVAELNRYQPASVAGFLSVLTMLAAEQEAGRLHIRPAMLLPGGETASAETIEHLATVFHAKVRPSYAATECGFLSYSCAHGWYHVNSDWALVEPVDADHRPVPPGHPSHTVLLSNLANRVQPILRYDLGDSVLLRPDPCPCGSPFPAIRVQGRAADLLTFPGRFGEPVSISPMLFGTLLDRAPGVEQFQVVQTTPTTLRVRLQPTDADHAWQTVRTELTRLLTEHKADDITIERAEEPPLQAPSGKYRRIIPLAKP